MSPAVPDPAPAIQSVECPKKKRNTFMEAAETLNVQPLTEVAEEDLDLSVDQAKEKTV